MPYILGIFLFPAGIAFRLLPQELPAQLDRAGQLRVHQARAQCAVPHQGHELVRRRALPRPAPAGCVPEAVRVKVAPLDAGAESGALYLLPKRVAAVGEESSAGQSFRSELETFLG